MRILFEGICRANYLAKCHEAFRTGLRRMFDTRMFGPGYDGYDPALRTYTEIIEHTFPNEQPDLLITEFNEPPDAERRFNFDGLSKVQIPKVTWMCDYWNATEHYYEEFLEILKQCGISMVMSYFPQPLEMYANTPFANRFAYIPPSFDPAIFNDWHITKEYDVGFLAAGTTEYMSCYPERFIIHQRLLRKEGIKYLWSPHPGWQPHPREHPLVGVGFSKAINSCRLFVTTGGEHRNANAKYVEILASKTVLLADEPEGADRLYLQDGVNYVQISEENVLEKIDYYLAHPELCEAIAESGYRTAMKYHTCYTRAYEFYEAASSILQAVEPSQKQRVSLNSEYQSQLGSPPLKTKGENSAGNQFVCRVEGQRLAWYHPALGSDYWDQYWLTRFSEHVYAAAERGQLIYCENAFIQHLPKAGRILDAGCGLGQYVLALRVRGYDVEGVEHGERTVQLVKSVRPDLPINVGDVTALDMPDSWYAGYISLGVVEHRKDGPEPFLMEAWRVLQPGGIALISVPYFHSLRRVKALLGIYRGNSDGLDFYQYAFTKVEFDELLRQAGFSIVGHFHYAGFDGLKSDIPLLSWLSKRRGIGRLLGLLARSAWLDNYLGHMTMAVCRKVVKP